MALDTGNQTAAKKHPLLMVATRKGAWFYHGDMERRTWRTDGPHFLGHIINHVVLDPRDRRTLLAAAKTGRLDPATGNIVDFDTGAASKPRRMAVGPDGMLWVTAYGRGRLLKINPVARKLVKSWALPAGESGGPYAVTVDAAGRVWANEIATDTVVVLEPGSANGCGSFRCPPRASVSARRSSMPRAATGTWAATTAAWGGSTSPSPERAAQVRSGCSQTSSA